MDDQIRIGWWNSGLSPPSLIASKKRGAIDPGRWELACRVVKQLLHDERLDFLALGEIAPSDAEKLKRESCPPEMSIQLIADRPLGDGGRHLAVLVNQQRLAIKDFEFNSVVYSGRTFSGGITLGLNLVATKDPLVCFVVHWPS